MSKCYASEPFMTQKGITMRLVLCFLPVGESQNGLGLVSGEVQIGTDIINFPEQGVFTYNDGLYMINVGNYSENSTTILNISVNGPDGDYGSTTINTSTPIVMSKGKTISKGNSNILWWIIFIIIIGIIIYLICKKKK